MKNKLITIMILGVFLLVGCGNKSNGIVTEESKSEIAQYDTNLVDDFGSGERNIAMDVEGQNETKKVIPEDQRKIINSAEVYLETDEFDDSLKTLKEIVESFGGYIESSDMYNGGINDKDYKSFRNANYSIRVPKKSFERFIKDTSKVGVVTNERTFAEDVSSQYYDSEARLKVLKAQEERYLAILSEATAVAEVIEIEKALTEVRYEIEMHTGYLKDMDDSVDMSRVNITISEVAETSKSEKVPVTMGEKINKAFKDSLKSIKTVATGIVLFTVMAIPYVVILAIISIVVYFVYKKIRVVRKPRE